MARQRPKAGYKSVLALLLTLDLLRERTADDAVPVMLSASSWAWRERLDAWQVRRLAEDYLALRDDPAVGAQGLRRLVESCRILSIADGLDEMDATPRGRAWATGTVRGRDERQ